MSKVRSMTAEVSPQKPEWILTKEQLMEELQIKETTLNLLIKRDYDPLPCSKIKTSADRAVPILRFRWSKVEAWLERQE